MSSKTLLFFLLLTVGLFAIDGTVSVDLAKKKHLFVSEEVIVTVDLKTDAHSITGVKIGLENSEAYIVIAPQSAAFLQTIDINGTDWQMVRYEYKLYPLHAGRITIEPFTVSFRASMGYGQPEKGFGLHSDVLILDIDAPKGVSKGSFVLSTPYYSLESQLTPKPEMIKAGDAFELKIIQKAENVPDVLLAPIRFSDDSHLKIYAEEPKLQTIEKGSGTVATRTDTFTFLAAREGNVSIPAQKFVWWDPATETLHTEEIPELHFVILPNPKQVIVPDPSEGESQRNPWALIIIFAMLVLTALYKLYPALKKWRTERNLAYQKSEKGQFKSLLAASRKGEPRKLYQAFYDWLEVADPELSRSGFQGISYVYPPLSDSLFELQKRLVDPQQSFDRQVFADQLGEFRKKLLEQNQARQEGLPKNINPV